MPVTPIPESLNTFGKVGYGYVESNGKRVIRYRAALAEQLHRPLVLGGRTEVRQMEDGPVVGVVAQHELIAAMALQMTKPPEGGLS